MKKNLNPTKTRIVTAAWTLFYQYGYENTTIDDIVEAAHTSKGSFYHYFDSKDSLLGSLSYLIDEKYYELHELMDPDMNPIDKLLLINQEVFLTIENTVSVSLLSQLLSSQLVTNGDKHMLDPDRMFYKLLRRIIVEGKKQGLFREDLTVMDITKAYSLFERGILFDWCINNGSYSISQYAKTTMPLFLAGFQKP